MNFILALLRFLQGYTALARTPEHQLSTPSETRRRPKAAPHVKSSASGKLMFRARLWGCQTWPPPTDALSY